MSSLSVIVCAVCLVGSCAHADAGEHGYTWVLSRTQGVVCEIPTHTHGVGAHVEECQWPKAAWRRLHTRNPLRGCTLLRSALGHCQPSACAPMLLSVQGQCGGQHKCGQSGSRTAGLH